jgi:hypothetical protein
LRRLLLLMNLREYIWWWSIIWVSFQWGNQPNTLPKLNVDDGKPVKS